MLATEKPSTCSRAGDRAGSVFALSDWKACRMYADLVADGILTGLSDGWP